MELCELCGKAQSIGLASVEGVDLQVCSNCSKYGIRKDQRSNQPRKILHRIEPVFHLTANYAALIRTMREKRKMSQQEFAGYLKERESAVAKWEQGQMQPSIETARKLERLLNVRLVEEDMGATTPLPSSSKGEELTLGDFIKVRKRK